MENILFTILSPKMSSLFYSYLQYDEIRISLRIYEVPSTFGCQLTSIVLLENKGFSMG